MYVHVLSRTSIYHTIESTKIRASPMMMVMQFRLGYLGYSQSCISTNSCGCHRQPASGLDKPPWRFMAAALVSTYRNVLDRASYRECSEMRLSSDMKPSIIWSQYLETNVSVTCRAIHFMPDTLDDDQWQGSAEGDVGCFAWLLPTSTTPDSTTSVGSALSLPRCPKMTELRFSRVPGR